MDSNCLSNKMNCLHAGTQSTDTEMHNVLIRSNDKTTIDLRYQQYYFECVVYYANLGVQLACDRRHDVLLSTSIFRQVIDALKVFTKGETNCDNVQCIEQKILDARKHLHSSFNSTSLVTCIPFDKLMESSASRGGFDLSLVNTNVIELKKFFLCEANAHTLLTGATSKSFIHLTDTNLQVQERDHIDLVSVTVLYNLGVAYHISQTTDQDIESESSKRSIHAEGSVKLFKLSLQLLDMILDSYYDIQDEKPYNTQMLLAAYYVRCLILSALYHVARLTSDSINVSFSYDNLVATYSEAISILEDPCLILCHDDLSVGSAAA